MPQQKSSRRTFLQNTAKAGLATGLGISVIPALASVSGNSMSLNNDHFTSFDQAPLPYAYNALEVAIDAMTMEIHYSKHAATYAKNLKEAAQAEGVNTANPLEDVLQNISKYSPKMRNNGGGHYNHELFWKLLTPNSSGQPNGKLKTAIEKSFNSFDAFKTQFAEAAKTRFGSGWAWLYVDGSKQLKIGSTPNQDNPLMNVSDIKGIPVAGLDVWEHAYYLKYQNKRPDYIENWWKVLNWEAAGKLYEAALK